MNQLIVWIWSAVRSASRASVFAFVVLLGNSLPSLCTEQGQVVSLCPPKTPALTVDGNKIMPRFAIPQPREPIEPSPVFAPIIFADVWSGDEPAILVHDATGRWSLHLPKLGGHWQFVGVDGYRHIWAVLDTSWINSWTPLTLIRSTDGGQRWIVMSQVSKPSNWARFEDLRMDSLGNGRLTLAVKPSAVIPGDKISPGLYHYRTTDFGETWSDAEFEKNELEQITGTALHEDATWDPSVNFNGLWQDYLISAQREKRRAKFTGITWSDLGSKFRLIVHTRMSLESAWSHDSLSGPPRELIRIRGIAPVDSQVIPIEGSVLKGIRVGFHQETKPGELHVVLILASPVIYIQSMKIIENTDLEIVLASRR